MPSSVQYLPDLDVVLNAYLHGSELVVFTQHRDPSALNLGAFLADGLLCVVCWSQNIAHFGRVREVAVV